MKQLDLFPTFTLIVRERMARIDKVTRRGYATVAEAIAQAGELHLLVGESALVTDEDGNTLYHRVGTYNAA